MMYLVAILLQLIGGAFTSLIVIGNLSVQICLTIFSMGLTIIFLFKNYKLVTSKIKLKNTFFIESTLMILYLIFLYLLVEKSKYSVVEIFKIVIYIYSIYFLNKSAIEVYRKKYSDFKQLKKVMYTWMKFNCYLSFIQFIAFHIFRIVIQYPTQRIYQHGMIRPAGLYTEPAHWGGIAILYFILSKDEFCERKKDIIFIIISLVLSGSTISIIVAILLALRLFINTFKVEYMIRTLIIISISIISLGFFLFKTDQGKRVQILLSNPYKDGSMKMRIIKGVDIYNNLNLQQKIIGINQNGLKNIDNYISWENSDLIGSGEYMSGLTLELISYGIIGTVLLNGFYYRTLNVKNKKFFFFVFEILRIGSSLSYMSMPMILFVVYSNIDDN